MPNQTCNKCKLEKPESAYHKATKNKNGLYSTCKSCRKDIDKSYYNHSSKKDRNKEYLAKIQELKIQAKVGGCIKCDEKEHCCLDFHHTDPSLKTFTIGTRNSLAGSFPAVKAEIEKCIVLCSNCHRKLHAGIITLS